jgi:predicted AAA+ superfamily ATPase
MKAGQIQMHLAETNRWWRSPGWDRDDPDLRAAASAPFDYRSGALSDLRVGGLYVLRGPRRVGKSTEIKHAVRDLLAARVPARNIVHAAVDGWRAEDLRTLVATASRSFLAGVEGHRYWFIDEITSVKDDWPSTIKNLRDNDAGFARDTVVLTGSSAAGLHEARKALAGRRGDAVKADRAMLPMRFTDVVAAAGLTLPAIPRIRARDLRHQTVQALVRDLIPFLGELVPLWETYLRVGGFPQAVTAWRRSGEPGRGLVEALWDVVHGDAISSARFAATQTQALLSGLARGLCNPLNVANLARDLAVTPVTAGERLADLADHFLIWPCYKVADGHRRDHGPGPPLVPWVAAQRKWYFTDPLLARLASLRSGEQDLDLTLLSEQQIGLCLLRNVGAEDAISLADFDSVLYYRSATDSEIDFVGSSLGEIAVESKYVDDRWIRALQTIHASPWFGIVASRSGLEWRDDAWVLPAPILALVLGG